MQFSFFFRCDATNIHLSKSNKKLLKRFNLFLKNGSRTEQNAADHEMETSQLGDESESFTISEQNIATANQPINSIDVEQILRDGKFTAGTSDATNAPNDLVESNELASAICDSTIGTTSDPANTTEMQSRTENVAGPDPSKPLRKKAKLLRAERKREKQLALQSVPAEVSLNQSKAKIIKNQEATLRSLVDAAPNDGLHKIKVR